ncbi:IS66 family insertion sequence element accessory protein TnpB [Pseudomonas brassicacearum]|uniref:IS66 family insertion sequence element accessory protein TnpB n=1 Tax=Pseudomonas brassicacearum TaxID=930166 RepID=UPI0011CD638A
MLMLVSPFFETCCDDSHRFHLARHRAHGYARWHRNRAGTSGGGVRCGAAALRAYLFANRRATRIKVLVHDGLGIWLAARRLHQGKSSGRALDTVLRWSWVQNSYKLWCWACLGKESGQVVRFSSCNACRSQLGRAIVRWIYRRY